MPNRTDLQNFIEQLMALLDLSDQAPESDYEQIEQELSKYTIQEQYNMLEELTNTLHNRQAIVTQGLSAIIDDEDVSSLSDLIDKDFFKNSDPDLTTLELWNGSLKTIFQYIKQLKEKDYRFLNDQINVKNIEESDAGNSFDLEDHLNTTPWVKPYRNIDGASYNTVRGTDRIIKDLTDEEKVDATHSKGAEWIRLLMPKNSRRIKIEDLNRNFWVIGQVLGSLCDGLFNGKIPLKPAIEDLLKEITGLWENMIYLWVMYYMLKKEISGKIQVFVLPLPTSSSINLTKYDNFLDFNDGEYLSNSMVIERVRYLIDRYPQSNLIIFPYLRQNNYKHNYFSNQKFKYVVMYNGQSKQVVCRHIASAPDINWINTNLAANYCGDNKLVGSLSTSVNFDPTEFKDWIYGVKEDEKGYTYSFPLSSIKALYSAQTIERYYGALRIKFYIEPFMKNGKIHFKNLKIEGYDGLGESLLETEYEITSHSEQRDLKINVTNPQKTIIEYGMPSKGQLKLYNPQGNIYSHTGSTLNTSQSYDVGTALNEYSEDSDIIYLYKRINNNIVEDQTENKTPAIYPWGDVFPINPNQAYYLGEIPSISQIMEGIHYDVVDNNIIGDTYMMRVGNIFPEFTSCGLETVNENTDITKSPTNYIWSFILNGKTSDTHAFYQPQFDQSLNSVTLKKTRELNQATRSNLQELSQNAIIDFIQHNYRFQNSNSNPQGDDRLYIPTFSSGVDNNGNEIPNEKAKISYFIGIIGIKPNSNSGSRIWNTDAYLGYLFRYVPKQWEQFIDIEDPSITSVCFKDINDELHPDIIMGYVECLGRVNRRTSPALYPAYLNGAFHLQQLIGSEDVMNYVRIEAVNSGILQYYYIDINQLPAEIKLEYNNSTIQVEKNKILTDYIEETNGQGDGIITEQQLVGLLDTPNMIWAIFDHNVTNSDDNKRFYDPGVSGFTGDYRQIIEAPFKINGYDSISYQNKDILSRKEGAGWKNGNTNLKFLGSGGNNSNTCVLTSDGALPTDNSYFTKDGVHS